MVIAVRRAVCSRHNPRVVVLGRLLLVLGLMGQPVWPLLTATASVAAHAPTTPLIFLPSPQPTQNSQHAQQVITPTREISTTRPLAPSENDPVSEFKSSLSVGAPEAWKLNPALGSVSAFRGSANYQHALSLPAAPSGLQPALSADYSSAAADLGANGLLGHGWDFNLSKIGRVYSIDSYWDWAWHQNVEMVFGSEYFYASRGNAVAFCDGDHASETIISTTLGFRCVANRWEFVPRTDVKLSDPALYTLNLNGQTHQLIHKGGGEYVARSYALMRVRQCNAAYPCTGALAVAGVSTAEYWQVWTADGNRYVFGTDDPSEQRIHSSNTPVGWYLRRAYARHQDSVSADAHRFTTEYVYAQRQDNSNGVSWDVDTWLTHATYGNSLLPGRYQINLAYTGSGADQRLNAARVYRVGDATPINETHFAYYTASELDGAFNQDLKSVTPKAHGQSLPATTFTYQKVDGAVLLKTVDNGYGGQTHYAYEKVPGAPKDQHRATTETTAVEIAGATSTLNTRTFGYGSTICIDKKTTPCYSGYATNDSEAVVGHDAVTETVRDVNNTVLAASRQKFYLDLQRVGLGYEAEQLDAATLAPHSRSETSYTVFTGQGVGAPGLPGGVWFTAPTTQTSYPNVGVPALVQRSSTRYTGAGAWLDGAFVAQSLSSSEWSSADPGAGGIPFRSQDSEFAFDAAKFLLVPTRARSYEGVALITEVSRYYDDSETLGALPGKGDLTRAQYTTNVPTPQVVSIFYKHNASGQPISQSTEARTALLQYDDVMGSFLTQVTDASGTPQQQVTRYEYYGLNESSPGTGSGPFGAQKASTDPNGARTEYAYDVFGRITQVVKPGDSFAAPTQLTEYGDTATPQQLKPMRIKTQQRMVSGCASCLHTSLAFSDGLGRALQSKTQHIGQYAVTHSAYDGLGRPLHQSTPTFVADAGYTPPDWAALRKTTTGYDTLGRTVVITGVDGLSSRTAYLETATGQSVATLDAKGHQRVQTTDVFGRLSSVREFASEFAQPDFGATAYATTRYGYDGRDNLTTVTDTLGNTTKIIYDGYNRKTEMTDPDMGRWQYVYDTQSNLHTQTDANNQTLWFKYDVLNRLLEKRLTNASGPLLASFAYDQGANGVGRRTQAIGYQNGVAYVTRNWMYDARGRATQETVTVEGKTFVFDYGYDAADRMTTLTYPADEYGEREIVTTGFDAALQPVTLTGSLKHGAPYISNATYNVLGLPQAMRLGAVATKSQTYFGLDTGGEQNFGRLRVSCVSLAVLTPRPPLLKGEGETEGEAGAEGCDLFKLELGYDNGGNITRWQDHSPGRETTMAFGYDALDRLTSASTSAGASPINESYGYDALGNLTRKGDVTQAYNANSNVRPHAVNSRTDGGKFEYDPNGNMTLRVELSGTQLLGYKQDWDAENRLVAVTDNARGLVTRYVYDADGKRIAKTDPDGLTIYVADNFEWVSTTLPIAVVAPTATLLADGDFVGLRVRTRGDYGVITFTAQAGQHLSLYTQDMYETVADYWIHTPGGTLLLSQTTAVQGPDFVVNAATGAWTGLPETGVYSVTLKPQDNRRGRYRSLLSTPITQRSPLQMKTLDKATHAIEIARPAQDGLIEFNGVAGRDIAVDLSAFSTPVLLYIYRPDGSLLMQTHSQSMEVVELDANGLFTLRLNPLNDATGSFNVSLLVLVPIRAASIAAGANHACRITPADRVQCWGRNNGGQLGMPTATLSSTALPVDAGVTQTRLRQVSAGESASCALYGTGKPVCWGFLPEQFWGSITPTLPPLIELVNRDLNVWGGYADLSFGQLHLCLHTRRGAVQCVGSNVNWGMLGDGTNNFWYWWLVAPKDNLCPLFAFGNASCMAQPSQVFAEEKVVALDAGYRHTCVALKGGEMRCWGANSAFELGHGEAISRSSTPLAVPGLAGPVRDVMAGFDNTCAVLEDGRAQCWGYPWAIGGGGARPSRAVLTPTWVVGLAGGVAQPSLGHTHACVLATGGAAQCWGHAATGTFGANGRRQTAQPVVGLGAGGASFVSAGHSFSCATLTNGGYSCWGDNTYGKLGDGTQVERDIPPNLPSLSNAVLLNTNGGPQQHVLTRAYDTAQWQVQMNAGESVHLAIESSRATNGHTYLVYGPDAREMPGSNSLSFAQDPTQARDVWNVGQSGRYVVQFVPDAFATTTYSLTASFAVTAAASVNGGGVRVSLLRPAQDARINFVGQSGQTVSVTMQGPVGSQAGVYVYGPDGKDIKSATLSANDLLKVGTLTASGMYTLRLNPSSFLANAPEATPSASLGTYTVSVRSTAAALAFEAQLAPNKASTIYLPSVGKQYNGANPPVPPPPPPPGPTAWQNLMATLQAQGSTAAARAEVTKYYAFGGARAAMRQANNEVFYLFGDHLGSASLVVDWQGRKISEMRYAPWGESRWAWELDGEGYTNRLYTSQVRQDKNYVGNLDDYGARFYNSTTGRFVSPDSVTQDGLNRYQYVRSNPIRYVDPSGNFLLAGALVGGIAGFVIGGGASIIQQLVIEGATSIDPNRALRSAVAGAGVGVIAGATLGLAAPALAAAGTAAGVGISTQAAALTLAGAGTLSAASNISGYYLGSSLGPDKPTLESAAITGGAGFFGGVGGTAIDLTAKSGPARTIGTGIVNGVAGGIETAANDFVKNGSINPLAVGKSFGIGGGLGLVDGFLGGRLADKVSNVNSIGMYSSSNQFNTRLAVAKAKETAFGFFRGIVSSITGTGISTVVGSKPNVVKRY